MLGKEWQKLKDYCAHVGKLLDKEQNAQQIYMILHNSKGAKYDRPCTQSDTQYCHILNNLNFWNEFLGLCRMEVKEVAPGVLGTDTLHWSLPSVSEVMHRQACILLHRLLKEHRCIRELKAFVAYKNTKLFFDALQLNKDLRRLELCQSNETRTEDVSRHMVAAIGTLTGLEDLVLKGVWLSEAAITLLGAAFENMPHLRSCSVSLDSTLVHGADVLIRNLKRSKTIKALHLTGWCPCDGEGAVLGEYLAEHDVLEELVLEPIYWNLLNRKELGPVLEALATNRVLRKLHLESYFFGPSQGPLLSRAMSANNTLRSYRSSGQKYALEADSLAEIIRNNNGLVELAMENVIVAGVEQLAAAIRTNLMMRRLSLCWSELSLEDITKLCEALAENRSLQMVTGEDVDEKLVADVHKVLLETGTSQRVKIKSVIKSPSVLQHTLESCHELTEVSYCNTAATTDGTCLTSVYELDSDHGSYESEGTPDPERSALSCLNLCSHLVKLEVKLEHKMRKGCAEPLAQFLSSTEMLKHAELDFPTTFAATEAFLGALSRNKSVSTLILSRWSFRRCHLEHFAEILERNRTLNYLKLGDALSTFLLKVLSTKMASNKFLISIKHCNCDLDDKEWMFRVRNVLRRNFSLLQLAAHFVMGTHDRRCGEAFEQVSRSAALSDEVQRLASESEVNTKQRIQTSRTYLDVNFLAVAGVVKDSLVCEGGSKGQTQLDQIGLDNWLRVRSYLMLADIRDISAVVRRSNC